MAYACPAPQDIAMFVFGMTTESSSDNKVVSTYPSTVPRLNETHPIPSLPSKGEEIFALRSRGNKKRTREKTKSHSDESHTKKEDTKREKREKNEKERVRTQTDTDTKSGRVKAEITSKREKEWNKRRKGDDGRKGTRENRGRMEKRRAADE